MKELGRSWSLASGEAWSMNYNSGGGSTLRQGVQALVPSYQSVIGCGLLSGIREFNLPGKGACHWPRKIVWTISWAPVSH